MICHRAQLLALLEITAIVWFKSEALFWFEIWGLASDGWMGECNGDCKVYLIYSGYPLRDQFTYNIIIHKVVQYFSRSLSHTLFVPSPILPPTTTLSTNSSSSPPRPSYQPLLSPSSSPPSSASQQLPSRPSCGR